MTINDGLANHETTDGGSLARQDARTRGEHSDGRFEKNGWVL